MSTIATQHDDVGQQTSSDPTAVRPFQVSFPEAELSRVAQANNRDTVA